MSANHGSFSRAEARQAHRLGIVLAVTVVFAAMELAGAVVARSQVLLADGVHLLLDVFALGLTIGAMRLAVQPPSDRFTFGLRRVEPLTALFNGVLVLAVACVIAWDAVLDLRSVTSPRPTVMLIVASAALVVHGASAWLIHDAMSHRGREAHHHDHGSDHRPEHGRSHGHALSLRAVWLHLAGDTLGALVALFAAMAIRLGGSPRVDPVGSLVVAVILALGAARLLRDAALVLLEAAPHHLPSRIVRDAVRTETGVVDVVQLRVWTLGAGHDAAAVRVRAASPDPSLATRIHDRLRDALGIEFVTVEVTHDAADETLRAIQSSRTL